MTRIPTRQGDKNLLPPLRFDRGRHWRAKIGFVLLATEQTVEDDVYNLAPDGVGVHFTRLPIADSITVDSLDRITSGLADAAGLLLPDGSLDVVCYACTSGSVILGESRVFTELKRGAPGAQPTSLITGVIRALVTVKAKSISIATPYLDEINDIEARYLQQRGFEVLTIHGLNLERDSDMVRVAPSYLYELGKAVDRPDADAVFISCGALRSLDIVDQLERELGKPVIVSNQAMIWDTLRLAGVKDRFAGYGRLFAAH